MRGDLPKKHKNHQTSGYLFYSNAYEINHFNIINSYPQMDSDIDNNMGTELVIAL